MVLSVLLVDMREVRGSSLTIRPVSTMMNHATTQLFFDDMPVPSENLIGEEGKGFSLYPDRHECRADADCRRMYW